MASNIDKHYLVILVFALFSALSYAESNTPKPGCEENGDCLSSQTECDSICGCDRSGLMAIKYNETTKSCEVSFRHLMIAELNIYDKENNDNDEGGIITGGTMANRIHMEAERIFNTILVSVILFITCCGICFVSACCYCCRISYSDYKLKNDVKALANKLKRDGTFQKVTRKQPQSQANQSCNIICEEAGVFVV